MRQSTLKFRPDKLADHPERTSMRRHESGNYFHAHLIITQKNATANKKACAIQEMASCCAIATAWVAAVIGH
jgi:hypothetical protein